MKIEGLKFKLCCLLLVFSCNHNSGFALNLGRIMTNSMYGEPLDADIALENTNTDLTASQIKVKLSDDIQFRKLGLKKEPYHDQLTFKAYSDSAKNWFIKVKSAEPISTQFLSFLLTVEWPQGQATREYITIMKAPIFEKKDESANIIPVVNKVALASTESEKQIIRTEENPSKDNELYKDYQDNSSLSGILGSAYASLSKMLPSDLNAPNTNSDTQTDKQPESNLVSQQNVVTYRPQSSTSTITVPGDTLSEIAEGVTQADTLPGITRQQMMIAIYVSNKHAFVNGDMARLKGNTTLNIPSPEQAREIFTKEQNNFDIKGTTIVQVKKPVVDAKIIAVNTKPEIMPSAAKVSVTPTKSVARQTITKTTPSKNVISSKKITIAKVSSPSKSAPASTATTAPDIIRISPIDGNIANLKITDAKKVDTQIAQSLESPLFAPSKQNTQNTQGSVIAANNPKAANPQTNPETTFDSTNALAQFNSIQKDIDNAKIDAAKSNTNSNANLAPKKLEIVTAEPSISSGERYLADAERIVTRQREIQDLKDQLAMLKAQIGDMAKLVALRTSGSVSQNDIATATATVSASRATVDQIVNQQVAAQSPSLPAAVINTTPKQQTVASDSYISSVVDSANSSLENINNSSHNLNNDQVQTIFYTIMGLIAAAALAGFAYQYNRREKREVEMVSNRAKFRDDINDETVADYNIVTAEEEFIQDYYPIHEYEDEQGQVEDHIENEHVYAQAAGIKEDQMDSYYRLVQAYLDLNDHVNAKKILDIIHNNGTPEQREYADRIYQHGS